MAYRDPALDWVPTAGQVVPVAWMTDLTGNDEWFNGDGSWTTVSVFTNSWTAGSPAPAYQRIGNFVVLRGVMVSGTAGSTAFTLPSGYRPLTTSAFGSTNGGGTATFAGIVVATSGTVTSGQSGNVWLNSVIFPVV